MWRDKPYFKRDMTWWTRERVLLGLRRFHKDIGFCPTSHEAYWDRSAWTGRVINGRQSSRGEDHPYPSTYAIGKFFKTMREAWTAAGFVIDAGYEEWSAAEDWFVIESVGILPRKEVAAALRRTIASVKRRLYDLGRITANRRWGITVSGAAHMMGLAEHIIRRYIDHGEIPIFRGYKLIYLNPADLLKIAEVDWTRNIHPDLERMIRRALIQRALKILKFGPAWREHEIYKPHRLEGLFSHRIKNQRVPILIKEPAPPPPNDLAVGDWAVTNKTTLFSVGGRVGIIRAVHFSPQVCERRDGTKRKCWVARVEFPRLKKSKVSSDVRINYTVPLDCLDRSERPEIITHPLSMNAAAVRQRKRTAAKPVRAGNKLQRIEGGVTYYKYRSYNYDQKPINSLHHRRSLPRRGTRRQRGDHRRQDECLT